MTILTQPKRLLRSGYRGFVRALVAPRHGLDVSHSIRRCALFYGDIPRNHRSVAIGRLDLPTGGKAACGDPALTRNFVCLEDFDNPRPKQAIYYNILYSSMGYALRDGRIDYSMSARRKPYSQDFETLLLRRSWGTFDSATLIESEFPNTYGDWIVEHAKTLSHNPVLPAPLLLPEDIGRRDYVRRELADLGIEFDVVSAPVRIRKAHVLHKPGRMNNWTSDDAQAYRRRYGIDPPSARNGSMIYLSREGVRSSLPYVDRTYKSLEVEAIVEGMGGQVVRTEGMKRQDFARLAEEAETVIGDHGAALGNILQWNTRNIIEIASDNWWNSDFVFLGAALGVKNHALLVSDHRTGDDLRNGIAALRAHFDITSDT